jgi:hypothetical protein
MPVDERHRRQWGGLRCAGAVGRRSRARDGAAGVAGFAGRAKVCAVSCLAAVNFERAAVAVWGVEACGRRRVGVSSKRKAISRGSSFYKRARSPRQVTAVCNLSTRTTPARIICAPAARHLRARRPARICTVRIPARLCGLASERASPSHSPRQSTQESRPLCSLFAEPPFGVSAWRAGAGRKPCTLSGLFAVRPRFAILIHAQSTTRLPRDETAAAAPLERAAAGRHQQPLRSHEKTCAPAARPQGSSP